MLLLLLLVLLLVVLVGVYSRGGGFRVELLVQEVAGFIEDGAGCMGWLEVGEDVMLADLCFRCCG